MLAQHIAYGFSFDAAMLQRGINVFCDADKSQTSVNYTAIKRTCDGRQDPHMQAEQSGYKQWHSARKCSGQWPLWGLSRSAAASLKHITSTRRSTTPPTSNSGVA